MKLIGHLLITVSVILGAIATTTSYVPNLMEDDNWLATPTGFAHLNAPAGAQRDTTGAFEMDENGSRIPLVQSGTELTPSVQARLREGGVDRVRVKEFSFSRWPYAWLFAVALLGLVTGGIIVKREARQELARHAANTNETSEGNPEHAIFQIIELTHALREELRNLSNDQARINAIIRRVDQVQKELSMQVVEGRNLLKAKLGLAKFAEFMDAFSRMERTLNRAWSAAADGVLDEAVACIEDAVQQVPDLKRKLT